MWVRASAGRLGLAAGVCSTAARLSGVGAGDSCAASSARLAARQAARNGMAFAVCARSRGNRHVYWLLQDHKFAWLPCGAVPSRPEETAHA